MRKYRNVPTEVDGISFASKAEAKRYGELKLLQQMGDISNLECHPVYRYESALTGKLLFRYIADFRYLADAGMVVEDVKGQATQVFRLKKRLIEDRFGIEIKLITKGRAKAPGKSGRPLRSHRRLKSIPVATRG